MIEELNDSTFAPTLADTDRPVLVDFYAPWCQPCKVQLPVVERLAESSGDSYRVYKVNADEAPEAAARLEIRSIPTLVTFRDGQPLARLTGLHSEEQLRAALEDAAGAPALAG